MTKQEVTSDIKQYLNEIALKLRSGRASIMVGAGFSRNANPSGTVRKFPLWNELGDIFYTKIHGQKPQANDKYLNAIKLADEVEAMFDRNTLDNILTSEIPDKDFQPSDLHINLLELPWTDVFTTNYDTLLERAGERVFDRKYEIVTNKEDLILSTRPRIIKLHGSFPSTRPFIISEEDYRTYPHKFAPFVNTVQQSMLENCLCLVGFSGDDPNFIKWIGWVRDNLGKENSPKIYLIGILNLSAGQTKLLEKRNITVIDFAKCPSFGRDHKAALRYFLDFLKNECEQKDEMNWPLSANVKYSKSEAILDIKKETESQLIELIKNWRNDRERYPNWGILPEENRSTLWSFMRNGNDIISKATCLIPILRFLFLFEFSWRWNKCLMPIWDRDIVFYKGILDDFNPFEISPDEEYLKNTENKYGVTVTQKQLCAFWIEISLLVLRYYREEGKYEEWTHLSAQIEAKYNELNSSTIAAFYYEKCLFSLFKIDIANVKRNLDKWPVNDSLPFAEAKRASILIEIGEVEIGFKILESSLIVVRQRLNLNPVVTDYSLVWEEAYILHLLSIFRNYNKFFTSPEQNINSKNDSHPIINSETYNNKKIKSLKYKFLCDPRGEIEIFGLNQDGGVINYSNKETRATFDVGTHRVTMKFGSIPEKTINAFSYFRFVEEAGLPIGTRQIALYKNLTTNAIAQIAGNAPHWALVTSLRVGNIDLINNFYNRITLSKQNQSDVDALIEMYIEILNRFIDIDIKSGDLYNSITTIIPEILSRMCCKCSYSKKLILLNLIKDWPGPNTYQQNISFSNLKMRLISSMTEFEQYALLPFLMKIPVILKFDRNNVDIFNYILTENDYIPKEDISVDSSIIDQYFEKTNSKNQDEHSKYIYRLYILYHLKMLTETQIELFGNEIWKKVDDSGFPSRLDFYKYSYLHLPHPSEINPTILYENFINSIEFPVYHGSNSDGLTITEGDIDCIKEISLSLRSVDGFSWNQTTLETLFDKLTDWWDKDKNFLLETNSPKPSWRNEFIARLKNINKLYSTVLAPNYSKLNENRQTEFIRIMNELPEYGLLNIETKAALFNYLENEQDAILELVFTMLFSPDKQKIFAALKSLLILIKNNDDRKRLSFIIEGISSSIRQLTSISLSNILLTMSEIVKTAQDTLSATVLKNISIGLSNLLVTSIIHEDDTIEIADEKLLNRINASGLALELYIYFNKNDLTLPSYINDWKNLSENEFEFAEVKNVWHNKSLA